jgi:hypothetical protein
VNLSLKYFLLLHAKFNSAFVMFVYKQHFVNISSKSRSEIFRILVTKSVGVELLKDGKNRAITALTKQFCGACLHEN